MIQSAMPDKIETVACAIEFLVHLTDEDVRSQSRRPVVPFPLEADQGSEKHRQDERPHLPQDIQEIHRAMVAYRGEGRKA